MGTHHKAPSHGGEARGSLLQRRHALWSEAEPPRWYNEKALSHLLWWRYYQELVRRQASVPGALLLESTIALGRSIDPRQVQAQPNSEPFTVIHEDPDERF